MGYYDGLRDTLGLKEWCSGAAGEGADKSVTTLAELFAKGKGQEVETSWWEIPFPSLDNLNESCQSIVRTRDFTSAVADGFLSIKNGLKIILDPITQPLSWMLDGALWFFLVVPWWVLIPALLALTFIVSRSKGVTLFVAITFFFNGIY